MSQPMAHMIRNAHDELERITLNDDDAQMAAAEGSSVLTNASAQEIFEAVEPLPPHAFMDDTTWRHLAPWLKSEADRLSEHGNAYQNAPAGFSVPAPDIPDEMLQLYADTLTRIFDPTLDTQAYLAISELQFARKSERPINESLFTPDILQMQWHAFFDEAYADLEEQAGWADVYAGEVASQNASGRSAYGDSAPGSYRMESLAIMWSKELEYALIQYPEDKRSISLTNS